MTNPSDHQVHFSPYHTECNFQKSSTSKGFTTRFLDNFSITFSLQRTKISIWLYDNIEMRIEGRIVVSNYSKRTGRRGSDASTPGYASVDELLITRDFRALTNS